MIRRFQLLVLGGLAFVIFGCQTSPFKEKLHKLKDPELVLAFLESIEKYWKSEFAGQTVVSWKSEIRLGKIPDFLK